MMLLFVGVQKNYEQKGLIVSEIAFCPQYEKCSTINFRANLSDSAVPIRHNPNIYTRYFGDTTFCFLLFGVATSFSYCFLFSFYYYTIQSQGDSKILFQEDAQKRMYSFTLRCHNYF